MKDFTVKIEFTVKAKTMTEATTTVINAINGTFENQGRIEIAAMTVKENNPTSPSRCDGCKVGNCLIDCPYIGCDDYY